MMTRMTNSVDDDWRAVLRMELEPATGRMSTFEIMALPADGCLHGKAENGHHKGGNIAERILVRR